MTNDTIVSLGTAGEIRFRMVPTESVLENPEGNPRKNIRQRDIDKLCESIIACGGILVPLVVFQGPTPGTYYLLDGERRLIAARKLGLKEVPVNILPRALAKDENLATMFTIHMARVPWNTMARAIALNKYLELRPDLEKDKRVLRQITGMSFNEINNALLVRMFPKAVQLRAVFPEKPDGLEPSYLIELARVIEKAEELGLSDKKQRPHVIESFLAKIGKVIRDPYNLKDLRVVLSNTPKREAQEIFQKLVEDPTYGIIPILLSYHGKIEGLRSLHIRATDSSIENALLLTKTQWQALLASLAALKGVKLHQEDLNEIKKLLKRTRYAVKAIL
jgi:ParB/RepB/Spo0J family partition protein